MSTTITALFDSRSDAEAAKERLKSARVDADHVHVHDKSSAGYKETGYSTHEDRGFWDSIKNAFVPDEDRHTYEEGVRRGGALLTADVDDDCVDEAVRVLEEANSIDLDDRSRQWRESGWDYQGAGATGAAFGSFGRGEVAGRTAEQEEVIPIVEEQLVVGKRDVSRGGVRVRSYVTETPVHEQIRLRNERVNVERRPVDQPLSAADTDAFRERTIDMTASGEEAVIGKNARVVEEVVVSKTAEEHVEEVDDTVRRTDVEVDRDTGVETRGSSFRDTDKRI
ncbi:YsnF/AvaK domain-containing protein [uncultured Sphingomonas sp.]|uniref:YsnF/AvaK domain-containing protein n=1 Tax=uncultured Sphingomonas sp. TaxID=158754 RepID=UPI00260D85D8|nr:YsnF/AvaK domain-containing protein [uncultured Sphingomonas sp.]